MTQSMAAGSADTRGETRIVELIVFESATWGNAEGKLMASAYAATATDCIIQSGLLASHPWSPTRGSMEKEGENGGQTKGAERWARVSALH